MEITRRLACNFEFRYLTFSSRGYPKCFHAYQELLDMTRIARLASLTAFNGELGWLAPVFSCWLALTL